MDEQEIYYLSEKNEKVEEKPKKDEGKPAAPPPKPYPVFGTDFTITEGNFIEFYKARMKIMAIKFKLVGQVNSQGMYVINEDIRRDLVRMEKEIEDSGENFYKAIALYMRKYFYFHVKIQSNDDGTAKATLFLSEFVDGFLGQDYIVTPVAEYNSINDDEFRIRVRKAFHLVDVETKNDDLAVPDLAVIMQDALDMEMLLGGFFDMASQVYLMKMLKALEESKNPTCKKVLDRYHELLALQNLDLNDKFKYIKYKSLLDNAIDEIGGMEKLGLGLEILKPIIADFNKITQVIQSARKGILEMDTPGSKPEDIVKQINPKQAQAPKKAAGNPPKQQPPAKKPPEKKPPKVEAKQEPPKPTSWKPDPVIKPIKTAGRASKTSAPPEEYEIVEETSKTPEPSNPTPFREQVPTTPQAESAPKAEEQTTEDAADDDELNASMSDEGETDELESVESLDSEESLEINLDETELRFPSPEEANENENFN